MKVLHVMLLMLAAGVARACDLCACGTPNGQCHMTDGPAKITRGFEASVFEQYTYFGTLQEDGDEVSNPADQEIDSSITQLVLGYRINNRVAVQFNLPVIYRSFRRPEGTTIQNGSESGIGDVSLIARVRAFEHSTDDATVALDVVGGVKFPTGDSDRLKEEQNETPPPPGYPESAVHGHDLALGSGSFDGVVGGAMFARWRRLYGTANLQYAIRTEGDFHYQYANDLTWSGGPGVFVVRSPTGTVGLQFNVAGESKGNDQNDGGDTEDTGITSVYLGPALTTTWRNRLSADLAVDFPVYQNNTSLQIVTDYRIRAGATWRF
jgi:hypothetical protein